MLGLNPARKEAAMKAHADIARIRIEAPNGDTALILERRLSHLSPTTVSSGALWQVELDDDGDRLDEILAAVKHWLAECEIEATAVHVGTKTRHVAAHPARP
jgi:hypothetical protein